jgi:hypothetical protein
VPAPPPRVPTTPETVSPAPKASRSGRRRAFGTRTKRPPPLQLPLDVDEADSVMDEFGLDEFALDAVLADDAVPVPPTSCDLFAADEDLETGFEEADSGVGFKYFDGMPPLLLPARHADVEFVPPEQDGVLLLSCETAPRSTAASPDAANTLLAPVERFRVRPQAAPRTVPHPESAVRLAVGGHWGRLDVRFGPPRAVGSRTKAIFVTTGPEVATRKVFGTSLGQSPATTSPPPTVLAIPILAPTAAAPVFPTTPTTSPVVVKPAPKRVASKRVCPKPTGPKPAPSEPVQAKATATTRAGKRARSASPPPRSRRSSAPPLYDEHGNAIKRPRGRPRIHPIGYRPPTKQERAKQAAQDAREWRSLNYIVPVHATPPRLFALLLNGACA